MSGIVGSKLNIRGSGRIAKLGTDGQVLTSAGAGVSAVYEDAAGGGLDWQSVVTGSTLTAVAGRGYPINTLANACTVTLPASASVGDTIQFVDYARFFGTNNLTLNTNSLKFQGATTSTAGAYPIYSTNGQSITITYVDATKGWIPTVDDDVTLETPQTYTVDFLIIGGGGGGGGPHGGGGGAGGFKNSYGSEASGGGGSSLSTFTFLAGALYTVTIGSGGASNTAGVDTTISGTNITTTTSAGGGEGGSYGPEAGAAGGSGGGGSGTGGGGAGTSNQGYAGGSGSGPGIMGGGGGGASAVGSNASSTAGGAGAAGVASAITGSSVTYGGGGGGGGFSTQPYTAGAAGSGGGGAGASSGPGTAGNTGTANTGGGGGGGGSGDAPGGPGGVGGSGVVFLRMATAKYSTTITGSPTVTTDGSDTIIKFTGSGTILG
jgi:hypothetical protein